jgi:hypothetical protein
MSHEGRPPLTVDPNHTFTGVHATLRYVPSLVIYM